MRFICVVPCFHEKHRFKKGDIFDGSIESLPSDGKGNLRHFRSLDGHVVAPVVRGPEVIVNEKSMSEPEEIVAEEKHCDICGSYKGTPKQIRMHKLNCGKKSEG